MKFVAVGDNCIDWYFLQNEGHVGGCSVNVSVYIRQLGGESAYIGIVGKDENGRLIRDTLAERGVDISHLHMVDGTTAVTRIELVDNDRTFRGYEEGVLAQKYISEEDLAFIRSRDYMHTSVYGNCREILKQVSDDVIIAYDFAYKLDDASVPQVLPHIHYGFFSYEKEDPFIRGYLKKCWDMGGKNLKLLIATIGKEGSLSYDGQEYYHHRVKEIDPVDTMGAGDSFISGFLMGLSEGKDYKTCMELGSRKAEETLLCEGAF